MLDGVTIAAVAATPADLAAARIQMAVSLGWHIIVACFGVGMPAITVFAEWRGLRTGDRTLGGVLRAPSLLWLFWTFQSGVGSASQSSR